MEMLTICGVGQKYHGIPDSNGIHCKKCNTKMDGDDFENYKIGKNLSTVVNDIYDCKGECDVFKCSDQKTIKLKVS